ncbi:MAG: nucleotidyltransferase family protein [Pseudomonadota bacterium]
MCDQPDAVLMFAAGFGTRMGALTADRPKPLIQVAGRPLIDYALDEVRAHGTSRIVVNLHYKSEMIRSHLAEENILFSEETPDILETGGGLRAALPLLGQGPVFTMNTDAIWSGPNPLSILSQAWRPDKMDALLLCVPCARAEGHEGAGDFLMSEDGRVARGPGAIYSGLQIIRPERVNDIEDSAFSLNLLWDQMMRSDRLYAVSYPGRWCDVGRPEGIAVAEKMLAA